MWTQLIIARASSFKKMIALPIHQMESKLDVGLGKMSLYVSMYDKPTEAKQRPMGQNKGQLRARDKKQRDSQETCNQEPSSHKL